MDITEELVAVASQVQPFED